MKKENIITWAIILFILVFFVVIPFITYYTGPYKDNWPKSLTSAQSQIDK